MCIRDRPTEIEESSYSSPEYWVGYVLAYAQWYFNKPFSELVAAYPCSKLIGNYFPYHETDITNCLELFRSRLNLECKLKTLRKSKKLSQTQLSLLSGVPVRTIKAYEQGKLDICKAQAETPVSYTHLIVPLGAESVKDAGFLVPPLTMSTFAGKNEPSA